MTLFYIVVMAGAVGRLAWLFTPWHKRRHGCGGWSESAAMLAADPACTHRDFVDVLESWTGERVARLCLICDTQLDAGFWPAGGRINTPAALTPAERMVLQVHDWSPGDDDDVTDLYSWGSDIPLRRDSA